MSTECLIQFGQKVDWVEKHSSILEILLVQGVLSIQNTGGWVDG